jgi:hypothetical protein
MLALTWHALTARSEALTIPTEVDSPRSLTNGSEVCILGVPVCCVLILKI